MTTPYSRSQRLEVEPNAGAGLIMLSLAQAILIFTFWITIWPSSFGIPDELPILAAVAGFFIGGSLCGFYLGFAALAGNLQSD